MPTPNTIFSYPSIHGRSFARRLAHRRISGRPGSGRPRSGARPARPFFLPSSTQQVKRSGARRRASLRPRTLLREVGRATLALGGLVAWATVILALAG